MGKELQGLVCTRPGASLCTSLHSELHRHHTRAVSVTISGDELISTNVEHTLQEQDSDLGEKKSTIFLEEKNVYL